MSDRPNCPCGDKECVGCTSGAPVSPDTDKGLDFEKAATESELELADTREIAAKRGAHWLRTQIIPFRQPFLDSLSAQHLAALEGVRKEERARREQAELDLRDVAERLADHIADHAAAEAEVSRLREALERADESLSRSGPSDGIDNLREYIDVAWAGIRAALAGGDR